MKKLIAAILIATCFLTGCNNHSYDYAYVTMPNNSTVLGKVESYVISSGIICVTFTDGSQYATSANNCVLVKDSPN